MKKIFTKKYLETLDIETLSDILEELCDILGYSEDQIDELFDDMIALDTTTFEPDKTDLISWILHFQKKRNRIKDLHINYQSAL